MSLDNNTLVAPSGEQNAELTPTEPKSKSCAWPTFATFASWTTKTFHELFNLCEYSQKYDEES